MMKVILRLRQKFVSAICRGFPAGCEAPKPQRMRKWTLTAKLVMLILPICVVAQAQVHSPPPRTNEPTTGTITGTVVNEAGQPMAGASTFVRAVNSVTGGRSTISDSEGNFQVSGLEPRLYIVGATAPAYTPIPPDPNTPPTYYRIGDSVRIELVRGGVITGTVTNALGEPVIAVRVRATRIRDAKGQAIRMPSFGFSEQQTDDRGIYRMYGVVPGTYLVSAGGLTLGQSFQFNPYDSDLPTFAPSSTRDNAAEVIVRGGEETAVDIRYRGEPGYTISGTAKVSGANGVTIILTPVRAGSVAMGNVFQPLNSRGFAFHGIGDGEYELLAQEVTTPPGLMTPAVSVSEPKRITIKGASVSGIELVPKPLASISGKIVLEPSKIPDCQGKRPPLFAETLVQLRRPERDPEKDQSLPIRVFGGFGSPDQNGTFVLRNLSPGRYQFEPRFYARYWYVQSITMGGAARPAAGARSQPSSAKMDAAANWTVVKSGDQLRNLTVTLAAGAASIRGKATSGESAAATVVYLIPAEPDKADDVLRFFVTEIAADGTFALNNLPPGRYWALTQINVDAQTSTSTKLRQPEAAAARTKLRKAAESQKAEIELKPCQNVTDYELKL